MLPDVKVELVTGGMGRVPTGDDRVCALIVNGVNDRPLQIFKPDDAFGHATNVSPYSESYMHQIRDFYAVAGEGTELWVQSVDPTLPLASIFTGGIATELMNRAGGRISVVGVSRFVIGETPAIVEGVHPDTLSGMDEAHAWAEQMAAGQRPCRIILDGKFLDPTLNNLRNLKGHTFNRVGVLVGSIRPGRNASVGFLLGRVATTPVHINLGRRKDGAMPTSAAYLTSNKTVEEVGGQLTALNQKGYIFLRRYPGSNGYYFVGGGMATADTDDFFDLQYGRVIDKAARLAYQTFSDELLDSVQVDARTGRLPKTVVKNYQARIQRALGLTMAAKGEISGVEAFIDPAQDILATSELVVDLRVVPMGLLRQITVKLGLRNPTV